MTNKDHAQVREPGYYWIRPTPGSEWVIGYWYEGIIDACDNKSAGYFDCSNHWDSDIHTIYNPYAVLPVVQPTSPTPIG